MMTINKKKNGYAIMELLFYIAFFSIFSLIITNSMITMTRSFKEIAIQTQLAQSGSMMERMSREIRQAYGINSITGNKLKLNTGEVSSEQTIEFSLADGDLELLENDSLLGDLNADSIEIVGLNFTEITLANGEAVKISLTVKSKRDALARNV